MGRESISLLSNKDMQQSKPERELKLDEQLLNAMTLYFDDIAKISPTEKPEVKANLKNFATEKLQLLKSNEEFRKMQPAQRYLVVFEGAKKLVEEGRINEKNIEGLDELAKHLDISLIHAVKNYLKTIKAQPNNNTAPEKIDVGKIEKPSLIGTIQTEIEYVKTVMHLHELGHVPPKKEGEKELITLKHSLSQENVKILEALAIHINDVLKTTYEEARANQKTFTTDEFNAFKLKHIELQDLYPIVKQQLAENAIAAANEKPF